MLSPPPVGVKTEVHCRSTLLLLDIRGIADFKRGHIPGALSFPLLVNPARWRNQLLDPSHPDWDGLKSDILSFFKSHSINSAQIYCHTGSWRSNVFSALSESQGIKIQIFPGGYRAFRDNLECIFSRGYRLIVIGGNTGSGKTVLLEELYKCGEQVVNLEQLAGHKGSVFGRLEKKMPQITNEQFRNELAEVLRGMDLNRKIWVEDEGKYLGHVGIPSAFWIQIQMAPVIRLETPNKIRIQNIVGQYGHINKNLLSEAINSLKNRISVAESTINALYNDDLHIVVSQLLKYYDQVYALQMKGRNVIANLQFKGEDINTLSLKLIKNYSGV